MLLSPAYESHSHNLLSIRTHLINSLSSFPSRSTDASLPSAGSLWSKFTKKGGPGRDEDKAIQQAQMALARQRLVTLVFGDMETVRMVCPFFIVSFPNSSLASGI